MRKSPTPRQKAFSYVRFSTPEQSKGDSLPRQLEAARRYASQQGLDLDETLKFQDLGMSAHHGRNAEVGALAGFLEAVSTGLVPPGSFLLVESLDRISRQVVRRAVRTLESLVDAGITVVDLSDGGRAYNTHTMDTDPFAFVMMALRFIRAHEESATKGMRVAAAYDKKREQAAAAAPMTKPFTRMLPGWLKWDNEALSYVVDEPRAETVRYIYERADAGAGHVVITRELIESGLAPWGDGMYWHRSYVQRILKNSAVIGTFTPYKVSKDADGVRRRVAMDPIPNFWPAVVERELFDRISSRLKAKAPKGRHAHLPPSSIFAGVLHCAKCGNLVSRISKAEPYIYLVCTKAHSSAGCEYQTVRYVDAVSAMTTNAKAIVASAPRGEATKALEQEIRALDDAIFAMTEDARSLLDELALNRSDLVRSRLRELEADIAASRSESNVLVQRRDTMSGPYVGKRLANLLAVLSAKDIDISAVNRALKETAEKIVMDPEAGELSIHWKHAPATPRVVRFYSRHNKEFAAATE